MQRFWSKADKSGDCWNWTASRFADGYGQFKLNKKNWRAHRLAYTLAHGEIPADMCVCQRNCGGKLFAKLAKHIDFSVQAHDEVEDVIANTRLGQRMAGYSLSADRQPWTETVAKLKASPPIYARAW